MGTELMDKQECIQIPTKWWEGHLHGFCPDSTGYGAFWDSQGLNLTQYLKQSRWGNLRIQSAMFYEVRDHWCHCEVGPVHRPGTVVAKEGMVIPEEDEDAKSRGSVCSL